MAQTAARAGGAPAGRGGGREGRGGGCDEDRSFYFAASLLSCSPWRRMRRQVERVSSSSSSSSTLPCATKGVVALPWAKGVVAVVVAVVAEAIPSYSKPAPTNFY